jgi:hypothetical protein
VRTYGEVIDVRTAVPSGAGPDDATSPSLSVSSSELGVAPPAQFLWRGRLYLVRDVLAHWVELGTWWSVRGGRPPHRPGASSGDRSTGPRPGDPASASDDAGSGADAASASGSGTSTGIGIGIGTASRSVAADVGAVEREVWRVEAAAGRSAVVGVYDLVRDVAAVDPRGGPSRPDRWRLARALD